MAAAGHHYDVDDDDFGLNAYNEIQAELGQWGNDAVDENKYSTSSRLSYSPKLHYYAESSPLPSTAGASRAKTTTGGSSSSRSPRLLTTNPTTPGASYTDNDEEMIDDDDDEEFGRRGGPVGVQTPQPPPPSTSRRRHRTTTAAADDSMARNDEQQQDFEAEQYGVDYANITIESNNGEYDESTRLFHDALLSYLQNRERCMLPTASVRVSDDKNTRRALQLRENGEDEDAIMGDRLDEPADAQEKAQENAALADVEMKFLKSLGSICLSRASAMGGGGGGSNNNIPQKNEGNFWNLLLALRAHGLPSLFYCVHGEDIPELTLAHDPTTLVDSAPADVLDICLGSDGASLPLKRLYAVLRWIEDYHGREFEKSLDHEYQGNDENPLLPPPRRRTMWPSTLATLKQRGKTRSTVGVFHPDAPIQTALASQHRSISPAGVAPFSLEPQDEVDDARLLRACFMLIQAGRMEEATKLVHDCGQPWRAVSWTGGEPLSADGVGNPTRALWKSQCRKIAKAMTEMANTTQEASMADISGTKGLNPSIAYEAAIMSLLSDNIDTAFSNPVFQTWEDGLHAILRSEVGIIEDDVLTSHNDARVEVVERGGGYFPHPGTEFQKLDTHFQGSGGNLGVALEILAASPMARMREEGGDPFRTGITSFLVGQYSVKKFIVECALLCLEMEDDEEASFLRFITHLVLYVSTVLPEFCSELALPSDRDATAEESMVTLHEQLILKYVAHLTSRRDLWPHVALYSSLLSEDNIIATFSSFLVHVHSEREREMTLKQARDLFPEGFDCLILRNVVRDMINSDENDWTREPGESAAPIGVASAHARMMRSIHWLCFYPEHGPDALAAANMLLRKFFLMAGSNNTCDASDSDMMHNSKVFIEQIFPRELLDVARESLPTIVGCMSLSSLQNLAAEYLSIEIYLKAHTKYMQFLGAIATTSPSHKSKKLVDGSQSKHESEIADKMERNTFRQKKAGICKMIIESASRASDALMEVLTFEGGWLVDAEKSPGHDDNFDPEEAATRSDELERIRYAYVPKIVSMLHKVLNTTALWLEQIVHDTLAQFGDAAKDMILSLFGSFDASHRVNDDSSIDLLSSSKAAPGFWHKKALSLASVVANDGNCLHEAYDRADMESFLVLIAESHISLSRTISLSFIEC